MNYFSYTVFSEEGDVKFIFCKQAFPWKIKTSGHVHKIFFEFVISEDACLWRIMPEKIYFLNIRWFLLFGCAIKEDYRALDGPPRATELSKRVKRFRILTTI